MDDFTLNVRQIGQYPLAGRAGMGDLLLLQLNGLGGAYASIESTALVETALNVPTSVLQLDVTSKLSWAGAELSFGGNGFTFNAPLNVTELNSSGPVNAQGGFTVQGELVATQNFVNALVSVPKVDSFNGRTGHIQLLIEDVLRAGGAPTINPHFAGVCTAPTLFNPDANDDLIATTAWVQMALCRFYDNAKRLGVIVTTFNGRGGDVVLTAADITAAATVPGVWAMANTAPSGDTSKRIANTAFVDDAVNVVMDWATSMFETQAQIVAMNFAPLNSPQFTGIPTAPTAAQTVNSGQLATTAFVHAAVTASTTGVSSFNGRTGTVVLTTGDITDVGGALLVSPIFTGTPQAPTATPGTNTTQLATTAFVEAALGTISAGVVSFNTRTGAVTLTAADVQAVGGAPIASPAFSGTPTAPTPAPTSNNTSIATTAYVTNAIAALPAPVTSFNGRTGAISLQASDVSAAGGALLASPIFTGSPSGPTATAGTSNTQLATTAFVQAAIIAAAAGVASFNTRTGAVTLLAADVTGVGGALLASPLFSGTPAAPTAAPGTNTNQLATTAFVTAAIAATPGVTSFNGRSGSITLIGNDLSAAGGALLASPNFSGVPAAPTAAPGTNTTQVATTAFVTNAISAGGGVTSFNGRAGVVTLTLADITGAGGAVLASPAFTGTPTAPTAPRGTNSTQLASTAFIQDALNNPPGSTVQVFSTGGTVGYTKPAGCIRLEVICIGAGGGGGGGGGTGASNGGQGGNTNFSGLANATGGVGGAANGSGPGGTPGIGITTGAVNVYGGMGGPGSIALAATHGAIGGQGGASYFGSGGSGAYSAAGTQGFAAGSGGAGGGTGAAGTGLGGNGGGSGGYCSNFVNAPAASYTITIGIGGTAGSGIGDGYAGGRGADGVIIVKEYYR